MELIDLLVGLGQDGMNSALEDRCSAWSTAGIKLENGERTGSTHYIQ